MIVEDREGEESDTLEGKDVFILANEIYSRNLFLNEIV